MGSLGSSTSPMSVSLRKFTADDVKASAKWFGDDEVTFTTPNASLHSDEELERYFAQTVAPHPWYRLICVDGVPAGAIYFTLGTGAHAPRAELSYILAKEFWGKGIVTQAARLAVQAGFQEFGLARIQAYVMTTNIGSQRVLEKCGFKREGLLRNFVKLRVVESAEIIGKGFTVRNTIAGHQQVQAVAMRASADMALFYQCAFEGGQDVLHTLTIRQFFRPRVHHHRDRRGSLRLGQQGHDRQLPILLSFKT